MLIAPMEKEPPEVAENAAQAAGQQHELEYIDKIDLAVFYIFHSSN